MPSKRAVSATEHTFSVTSLTASTLLRFCAILAKPPNGELTPLAGCLPFVGRFTDYLHWNGNQNLSAFRSRGRMYL